ncbi:conserved hypothetical protein [Vibrio chagasii]|nr:conserved hypothetical protein [Vibrio chagasii]CAH7054214.1 conserved hypothetical protein [Vibrio chagasii]CAH7064628.1 conserved hypothetical protein [Vibrio chagasii]CAH7362181.1 conserved hypothetical protein [Vibrio chagasii]CAH7377966.1 conserved hypothetical protein [Vibrio chagasii]
MKVEKWFNGHHSPLIFMVDDLANIYFSKKSNHIYNNGDWGGEVFESGSLYHYLNNEILSEFPDLKITFFLVTGERTIQSYGSYDFSRACCYGEFPNLLETLVKDGHEIAYHGLNHGKLVGEKFIQEWSSYHSISEANKSIREGLSFLNKSLPESKVKGGKYCGYEAGEYGHASILANGFEWWFDRWDEDPKARCDGEIVDGIVYLPSNIDCSQYSFKLVNYFRKKKYYRSIIRQLTEGTVESKINTVISKRGILSFQEHSSPIRTDGKRQYPNVFDDKKSIIYLLNLVKNFDIWYATASEVCDYIRLRSSVKISRTRNKFEFLSDQNYLNGSITLFEYKEFKYVKVKDEKYFSYEKNGKFHINLPVYLNTIYEVIYG